jgi:hypothetical protein
LADFRRERPDVHPQLEIVNSQGVIDAIRENRSESRSSWGAEHPWARRRAIMAPDLLTDAYLTREAAAATRAVATVSLARAGIDLTLRFRWPVPRVSNAR